MRVLVVDDDPELLDLVVRALERDGHRVQGARSCADARSALSAGGADVIVLDVELPDGTGVALCRALRDEGERVPILLLTAHGEVPQRVAGLDAGADDFVAKPFAVAELRARVRALGRRGPVDRGVVHRAGGIELDLGARRARRDGAEVPLTTREWAIVELLAGRGGRVIARGEILDAVWGEITDEASASLDVLIARIRRKLGAGVIRTLRGQGYALGET
ncbi:response regulator transcription factor [Sandaracinus amylolyticus]|uniref:DNA-binding heavy metal response regulator n=1 Tax=Sandaracinus amylolyticus TaxID=927083 RepID=A0A0F6SFT1_9BACT|nr:response regulator transcription factor [Sandaracinus amylolyticus]AKF07484.1 DNA-binding heavy metal response regulator [Sandaracinus amylolyticus]